MLKKIIKYKAFLFLGMVLLILTMYLNVYVVHESNKNLIKAEETFNNDDFSVMYGNRLPNHMFSYDVKTTGIQNKSILPSWSVNFIPNLAMTGGRGLMDFGTTISSSENYLSMWRTYPGQGDYPENTKQTIKSNSKLKKGLSINNIINPAGATTPTDLDNQIVSIEQTATLIPGQTYKFEANVESEAIGTGGFIVRAYPGAVNSGPTAFFSGDIRPEVANKSFYFTSDGFVVPETGNGSVTILVRMLATNKKAFQTVHSASFYLVADYDIQIFSKQFYENSDYQKLAYDIVDVDLPIGNTERLQAIQKQVVKITNFLNRLPITSTPLAGESKSVKESAQKYLSQAGVNINKILPISEAIDSLYDSSGKLLDSVKIEDITSIEKLVAALPAMTWKTKLQQSIDQAKQDLALRDAKIDANTKIDAEAEKVKAAIDSDETLTESEKSEQKSNVENAVNSIKEDITNAQSLEEVSSVTSNGLKEINDQHIPFTGIIEIPVHYVNEDGVSIATSKIVSGHFKEAYTTEKLNIIGYSLSKIPENNTGIFTRESQIVTYVYKDIAPPTGVGKLLIVDEGDSDTILYAKDYSTFLNSYSDNDSKNDQIKVTLSSTMEEVKSLVSNFGVKSFKVQLTDKSGNYSLVDVPVFVKDSKTVLSADNSYAVRAEDFSLRSYLYPKTSSELKNLILKNGKVQLWQLYVDKPAVPIESTGIDIDTSNLPKPGEMPSIGSYDVQISYSAVDKKVSTTLVMTIMPSLATLNVEFVNEVNQVLSAYTVSVDAQVGDIVDLTKNDLVQKQLNNVATAGYDIAERPLNENGVSINDVYVAVQYKVQGILSLTSVPNTIDFGALTYNATTKRVEDPSFDKQLVVTDTRADAKNGWRMTASLTKPMRNNNGQELVNALRYVNQGKETILNQDSQIIYTSNKGLAGSYTISSNWGTTTDTDGIKLQINSSDTVYTGEYVGVITWKVMAGQP